jgi:DNA-binding NarL/FixJ family response regulator
MTTINVAIVEDDKDIRESLKALISSQPGFCCTGAFESGEAALKNIPVNPPDVVLMDINMPGITGIDAMRLLKEKFPSIRFVMCTVFNDDENIFLSLRAGASGYILKSSSSSGILSGIQEVYEGGAPMSPTIAKRVIDTFHRPAEKKSHKHAALTPREMEILQLLSRGLICKEVAAQLGLNLQTIRNHCANIYEKLQVNTRLEAINIIFGNKY